MTILGIDISLVATGVCTIVNGTMLTPRSITAKEPDELARLIEVVDKIGDYVQSAKPDIVVIEALALGSRTGKPLERAFVNFATRIGLYKRGVKAFMVTPTQLKKFAFGSGKAEKSQMIMQAYKLSGHTITPADDNQADAMCLAWIGACIAGDQTPANQAQRDIIAAVQNPTKKKRKKKEIA